MSHQTFDDFERWAIWKVYGQKCAECDEVLQITDMKIDHIVPEAANKNPDWQRLKSEFKINETFLLTFENLRSLCDACNRWKGDLLLHDGYLSVALKKAEKNAPRIRNLRAKKKQQVNRSGSRALALAAIKHGKLVSRDYQTVKNQAQVQRRYPSEFFREVDLSDFLGTQAKQLRQISIIGADSEVAVEGKEGDRIPIFTIGQFEKFVVDDNLKPVRGDEARFVVVSEILSSLSELAGYLECFRFARRSSFDELNRGLHDLRHMPAYAMGIIVPLEIYGDYSNGTTVAELLALGLIQITDMSNTHLSVQSGENLHTISEVVRGDFDDDGDEELLVEITVLSELLLTTRYHALKINRSFDLLDVLDIEQLKPV